MTYIRKTRDTWEVQQWTEYGWETVCSEENIREARQRRAEYRENQPEYPVRLKLTREPIEAAQPEKLEDGEL